MIRDVPVVLLRCFSRLIRVSNFSRSAVTALALVYAVVCPSLPGVESRTNTHLAAPFINSICPSIPQAILGNQTVEVRGGNFEVGLTVTVFFPGGGSGTLSGLQIGVFSSTQFLMLIDFNGNPGSYSIRVNNPSGAVSSLFPFQVSQTAQKPRVLSIDPSSPPGINGFQTIAVNGDNLRNNSTVAVSRQGVSVPTQSIINFGCTGLSMQVDFQGSAGSYSLTVRNPDSGLTSDPFSFNVLQVCNPPSITAQPTDRTINSGQQAVLAVSATGTGPLSYQWYQGTSGNTSNPVGTNSASFTTPILTSTTTYWVRISNSCGTVDSRTATVFVQSCIPPSITAQPVDQTITSGQQAGLVVSANGTAPISYQWYKGSTGNTSIPVGTNSASFTTPPLTTTTSYWVRVSNTCGSVNSRTVTVSIATCTLSCSASAQGTGTVGSSVSFTSTATPSGCNGTPIYDWDFGDGTAHSSQQNTTHTYATANTYTWTMVADTSDSNICVKTGTITISQACISPTITSQPSSPTINSGETTTLAVLASGTTPLSYQWYKGSSGNTAVPVGTNSRTFTTPPLTTTTSYWVRVSNACGSKNSNTSVVTVISSTPGLSGTIGICDGESFWPLDGANVEISVSAIPVDGRNVITYASVNGPNYAFANLPNGDYRVTAGLTYTDRIIDNTYVCSPDGFRNKPKGCGGTTLSKTATLRTNIRVQGTTHYNLEFPMPIVMVHGHNSCYTKWYGQDLWDNTARDQGFISFTPNYHSNIGAAFTWEIVANEIKFQVERNLKELSSYINDNAYPRWAYIGHSQGGLVSRVLVKGQHRSSKIVEKLAKIYLLGTPNSGGLPIDASPNTLTDFYACAGFLLQENMQSDFNVTYPDFGAKQVTVFAGTNGIAWSTSNDGVVQVDFVHDIYIIDCFGCNRRLSQHLDGQDLFYKHEELAGKKGRDLILVFNILGDVFYISDGCP